MIFFKKLQLLFLISFCFSLSCDAGWFRKAKTNTENNIQQIIDNEDIKKIIDNFEYKDIGKVKVVLNNLLIRVKDSNQIDVAVKKQLVEFLKNIGKK